MYSIEITTKEGKKISYTIEQLKELREILLAYEKEPFVGVELKERKK